VRTLLTIARKDFTVILRDKAAVLVMLAMPLALIFILGSALGGIEESDTIDAKVAIVDLDTGETGALFVDGLTGSEEIGELFRIEVRDDADAVRTDVERGDLTAALIIPEDLTDRIAAGEPVALEVLQDPGSRVTAGVWAGVVRAAVSAASAQIVYGRALPAELANLQAATPPGQVPADPAAGAPPVSEAPTLDAVTVEEVEATIGIRVSMISYYAAGMTGMFLLFGSMFGAFAFLKERREQTLARVMSTPASRVAIVGGKALGVFMLGAGQFFVLLIGTGMLFGVRWGEQIGATVALGLAEVFAAAGLAMTLAALGKSERAVGGIGPALIIFFAATGGSMLPIEMLPSWLRPLQVISPVWWTVDGFLNVMTGAGFVDVLGPIAAVLGIGAVLLAFGIWRLEYR
jgi:ABC-2 type transport system permease protein